MRARSRQLQVPWFYLHHFSLSTSEREHGHRPPNNPSNATSNNVVINVDIVEGAQLPGGKCWNPYLIWNQQVTMGRRWGSSIPLRSGTLGARGHLPSRYMVSSL